MATSIAMNDPQRARLEMRLMERLRDLDDATLRDLDEWLSQPVSAQPDGSRRAQRGWTRRQAITTMLLGGVAVAGAGTAATVLSENEGLLQGAAANAQRVADLSNTLNEVRSDAAAVGQRFADATNLLGLYDQLENVGIDDVVNTGLNAVATAIGNVAQGAQVLREGLTRAQTNINQLDEGLAVLDNGLVRAEGAVSRLSDLLQGLEDRLRAAGEPVAPITNALGGFFTRLLGSIPFVGDDIVQTIERVQAVVGAIPESIENINRDLFEPLRARFFPREGENVTVRLLDPLTNLIFVPADRVLGALGNLAQTWQNALEAPARQKLVARDELRKQIAAFRLEKGL